MTPYDMALKVGEEWVRISGAFTHQGFNYPENWLEIARPSDLKRVGVKPVQPADSPPPAHDIVGDTLVDVGGSPKRLLLTVPVPFEDAVDRVIAQLAADRASAVRRFRFEGLAIDAAAALSAVGGELALRQALGLAEDAARPFPLADGVERAWVAAELIQFSQLAHAHVQACAAIEAQALSALQGAETAAAALAIPQNVTWPKA